MNLLLGQSPSMRFHTLPTILFRALGPRVRELDWILMGLECNRMPIEFSDPEPLLFSGAELETIFLREGEHFQIIWGILLGLPPGTGRTVRADLEASSWNEATDVWESPPRWMHPKSILEIICWDSSETVLLSRDGAFSESFRLFFPEAVDLDDYNRRGPRPN